MLIVIIISYWKYFNDLFHVHDELGEKCVLVKTLYKFINSLSSYLLLVNNDKVWVGNNHMEYLLMLLV